MRVARLKASRQREKPTQVRGHDPRTQRRGYERGAQQFPRRLHPIGSTRASARHARRRSRGCVSCKGWKRIIASPTATAGQVKLITPGKIRRPFRRSSSRRIGYASRLRRAVASASQASVYAVTSRKSQAASRLRFEVARLHKRLPANDECRKRQPSLAGCRASNNLRHTSLARSKRPRRPSRERGCYLLLVMKATRSASCLFESCVAKVCGITPFG